MVTSEVPPDSVKKRDMISYQTPDGSINNKVPQLNGTGVYLWHFFKEFPVFFFIFECWFPRIVLVLTCDLSVCFILFEWLFLLAQMYVLAQGVCSLLQSCTLGKILLSHITVTNAQHLTRSNIPVTQRRAKVHPRIKFHKQHNWINKHHKVRGPN